MGIVELVALWEVMVPGDGARGVCTWIPGSDLNVLPPFLVRLVLFEVVPG